MNDALDPKQVASENALVENKPNSSFTQEKDVVEVNHEEKNDLEPVVEIQREVFQDSVDSVQPESPEENISIQKTEIIEKESEISTEKLSIQQIIDRLTEIVELPVNETNKNEIDSLKQSFYKQKRQEVEAAKQTFIASGGDEKDFQVEVDETEEKLKSLLQSIKEKRASIVAEEEKKKETNLGAKKAIIEQLKSLIESQDDFYKIYNEFKKLQQEWKEIKSVPQSNVNEIWKEYQLYSEKFYDLLKINNEMRDYDFKKNLELKETLCESVEKLEKEPDVISAFHQLQKFHHDWREIGPVAKEFRDATWDRFKKASAVINKKHQDHFEALKELEQRNLDEKTLICKEMESINYDEMKGFKEWADKSKRVLELQDKWKTIGFAPKKYNVKIFERFRTACDLFFQKKSEFYMEIKDSMDDNLKKKEALCIKAEALKDSQEWKETSDKLIALQKEWKAIGTVSRKHSETVWKRFIGACDYFFEQKNIHFSSQKTEEVNNLKLKKELIEKIRTIDESLLASEAILIIREMMNEWNSIGFVPFKDKDKIYKEYRDVVDKHFDRLKIDESERRLQSFKTSMSDLKSKEKSKNKLLGEREKLMKTYERLKNDIQTYENNIGFLSVSSKGGGGLVKEMNRKIESLKDELKLIEKKVEVIDENFEA